MTVPLTIGISLLTLVASFGAAWGAMSIRTKDDHDCINEVKRTLRELDAKMDGISERLARMEGRMNGGSKGKHVEP